MKYMGLAVVCLTVACGKSGPSAMAVCTQLASAGVATNCKDGGPAEGLGGAASEHVVFDLPAVPGKTGQVLKFGKAEDYNTTVKAFDAAAILAGPHRYGSEHALVFVQFNNEAPADVGTKAAAVVKGL